MMRWGVLLLLLALAGCGGPPASPDQAACERLADDDPAVRAILAKGAGNDHFLLEKQGELKGARQDATVACLRGRGVLRRGGVERARP